MQEQEILTILSKSEYNQVLKLFKTKFKKHKSEKRLAIQSTDSSRDDLDTRIRTTNGNTKLMQKVGKWSGKTRQEIEIDLGKGADEVLKVFKILRNMLSGSSVRTAIIQTDSLIYRTTKFEIKLTHQWGKKDVYNAEIEVFDNSDPAVIAQKYNIPLHPPEHTKEFWDNWNKTVNLCADELSDKELLKIIKEYL